MEFLPMGRAEAENCVRDIKHFTPDKIVFDVAIVRINNHGKKSFLAHQKRNSSLYEVLLQDQVYDWDESIQHAVTRKVKEHTSLNVTKIVGSVYMLPWWTVKERPNDGRYLEFRGRVWAFYGLPNHYLGGIRSDDSALDKEVEEEEFYR
ncbi:hypothetical protein FPOAC1_003491 [Fusarium poae]|uniref:hypothetical protein n=1 Tax=Fusarium poae TaxID=36050 RepID=UPI001CE72899|nr:hypothetical protein FPOAC1_003491 [Fusarium poae]KAG8677473.1 hypothetical protein FPOAC1_003491 [Fusarium poae]